MTNDAIADAIREYLRHETGLSRADVSLDTPLFSAGLLDSLQLVGLVLFIEERFGASVKPLDVSLERFDSVERIAEYIAGHRTR